MMVIMFGPPGAGKSVQGQKLAAAHDWRWLSTGMLLRESADEKIHEIMRSGALVGDEDMNRVIGTALEAQSNDQGVIMDGYPRKIEQAQWLMQKNQELGQTICAIVALEVSDDEILRRLSDRGRADDTPETVAARGELYREKTEPLLQYFEARGIAVQRVNGEGTPEAVHERVKEALTECLPK